MENIEHVAIVGGGPAGAYCAYELAKKGIYATIFDHSHPREKPCGGGLSALAIEKFPIIRKVPVKRGIGRKLRLISPSGYEVRVGTGYSVGISRLHMDNYILDSALRKGAKLVKEKVIAVRQEDAIWTIRTREKTLRAKILVGADGVNSIVRRSLVGPIPRENFYYAYGYFVKGLERELTTMKFLKNQIGYIWIFPRRINTSIGIALQKGDLRHMRGQLDSFLQEFYPKRKFEVLSKWGGLIPTSDKVDFYNGPCAGKNWILVGDAAGHVDPVTGEGILYAMWSGELAAKVILNKNLRQYDYLWKNAYGYDLMAGAKSKSLSYNSFVLDLSIRIAQRSQTLSQLFFDIITTGEDYTNFEHRLIRDAPRIAVEVISSFIGLHIVSKRKELKREATRNRKNQSR
jgi:geranylgeranyl reductase